MTYKVAKTSKSVRFTSITISRCFLPNTPTIWLSIRRILVGMNTDGIVPKSGLPRYTSTIIPCLLSKICLQVKLGVVLQQAPNLFWSWIWNIYFAQNLSILQFFVSDRTRNCKEKLTKLVRQSSIKADEALKILEKCSYEVSRWKHREEFMGLLL